jgi:CheY-like chemotaxis protein
VELMAPVDRCAVLVVESDEAVRATLVEGLRDSGLEVVSSNSADASIDGWHGDVIITDTFASPYSTEAVVTYLKSLRSRFAAGLVVLSAHNGATADAAVLPADAVVMKPYSFDDLVRVITSVASDKRQRDARNVGHSAA